MSERAADTASSRKQPDRPLTRVPWIGKWLHERFSRGPTVAVLRLAGMISPQGGGPLRRPGLNLAELAGPIETAFKLPRLEAVALVVNSPGGSPVQSALIARRIRALAAENDVPVYAFCEDAAASGGYWLACAGDEIYADGASVVGSIGVIAAGFGFPEAIGRLGVERRIHAAGQSKSQLDPFQPEDEEDVARLNAILEDLHGQFKDWVRERRGDKLREDEEPLFEGAFWTGRRARELGLVDGIGDLRGVCREKFGEDVKLRPVSRRKGFLQRRFGFVADAPAALGAGLADGLGAWARERAAWARLGL